MIEGYRPGIAPMGGDNKTEYTMNDETTLLCLGRDFKEEVAAGITGEMMEAFKLDKAKKEASKLVCQMLKAMEHEKKSITFGYWKRIQLAEKQAIITTKLLDEQALALKDGGLCAHWVRVRIVIKERSYQ